MNSYEIVAEFERRVAAYAGSPYAVAVESCTAALFLCCKYLNVGEVTIPARTYCSVPMAIIHAGGSVRFLDYKWRGIYELSPYDIWDGAKRFSRGMYRGGLHCLSFHLKKHIPIGRGGMILTESQKAVEWLKKARYDGRAGLPYEQERCDMLGWNCYMTPEQAARGLMLLDLYEEKPDLTEDYTDLREHPVFKCA